jgi:hypothetical protein
MLARISQQASASTAYVDRQISLSSATRLTGFRRFSDASSLCRRHEGTGIGPSIQPCCLIGADVWRGDGTSSYPSCLIVESGVVGLPTLAQQRAGCEPPLAASASALREFARFVEHNPTALLLQATRR